MSPFIRPPRGSVKTTKLEDGSWRVDCLACGWTSPQPPYKHCRTSAEEHKRCHYCQVIA